MMMKHSIQLFVTLCMAGLLLASGARAADEITEKVVYHISDSSNAKVALNNIRNHLNATEGKVRIAVVTHGPGVDFLLEGAADKGGNPYNIVVEELMARGIDFRVCNNTLTNFKIDPKRVLPGATIVPSGVAEIGHLQAREGYVYLKP